MNLCRTLHPSMPRISSEQSQQMQLVIFGATATRKTAMTTSFSSKELRFEPPGPGSWLQDPVHFPRPMTRYWQELHPAACKRGTLDFARFYGLLIDGIQVSYINGINYRKVPPA